MLDFFIAFFQTLKARRQTSKKSWFSDYATFVLLFLFLIFLSYFGLRTTLSFFISNFWRGSIGISSFSTQWILVFVMSLIVVLFSLLLIVSLIRKFKARKTQENFLANSHLIYIPAIVISLSISTLIIEGFGGFSNIGYGRLRELLAKLLWDGWTWIYLVGFGALLIYPLIDTLQTVRTKLQSYWWLEKIKNIFCTYNLWYYFILSIVWTIYVFVYPSFWSQWYADGDSFFLSALSLIFILVLFTYPLFSLKAYFNASERNHKKIWTGVLAFVAMFVITTFVPAFYNRFLDWQITRSSRIIENWWLNYTTFKKAETIFLGKAYLNYFNETKNLNSAWYFTKIFDATPENYFGEKLVNISTRNSMGTNATKVWKNAQVILKLAEVTNNIISTGGEMDVMETTYKFHFTNTTTTNQEVKINFETPSLYSVVSDLKLWLYWELQGIIASRGAAAQVYADSLRINRDPALIQKVGLKTYSLSVFPILSKKDTKTQGRQLVQLTIQTPLQKWTKIVYSPQISMTNLKVEKETTLLSKIYKNNALLKEDIAKSNEVAIYLDSDHLLPTNILEDSVAKNLSDYCIPISMIANLEIKWLIRNNNDELGNRRFISTNGMLENYPIYDELTNKRRGTISGLLENYPIYEWSKNSYKWNLALPKWLKSILSPAQTEKNKIALFFDNSMSAKRNNTLAWYQRLFDTIKNYGWKIQDVDLYTYNFAVEKISSIDDLKFRGYSDVDTIVDFIEKNNITNQRIIILTDDDNFNMTVEENKNRNFQLLLSNQIDVIKIGDDIKTYKSDFTNLISATKWNIYTYNVKLNNAQSVLENVFENEPVYMEICALEEEDIDVLLAQDSILSPDDKTEFKKIILDLGLEKFMSDAQITGWVINIWEKTQTTNTGIQKIIAWYVWNQLLGWVENTNDWITVALSQSKIAKQHKIVNQFNSMIALETVQQYRDLERYENQKNKYDSTYSNNDSKDVTQSTPTRNTFTNSSEDIMEPGVMMKVSARSQTNWVEMGATRRDSAPPINQNNNVWERSNTVFTDQQRSFNVSAGSAPYPYYRSNNYDFWVILIAIMLYVRQIWYFVDVFYNIFFKKDAIGEPTQKE